MPLTREDLKTLADLARLDLPEEELGRMEKDLEAVLGYVDRLQHVDTKDVEPFCMPSRVEGWREDVASMCDEVTRETILSNFPTRKGDLLSVPAVFDKKKGERG
ncbi:Asp-tRNA(Asn)/Glu-tRNA(Gln) amidotransferase subunit GatC [Patescibacteria group bacterium]|nr:Asp-tRNA(Asn)/Glu-tRNA(Gln) amidotransferase subunit GatC [Patescibacteria group bacterium]MBU1448571.1 Asp-tRNA(Asn)/Glu-tRNA(Gln) amidotransferase subunit GatC [Patescibacteria group bacterium]MBU2612938.1 Asp-tRNA(Asn)/Glu-tRNA(Gln) amidotransferase subunit GatC [Patescibacteria group bacterium]